MNKQKVQSNLRKLGYKRDRARWFRGVWVDDNGNGFSREVTMSIRSGVVLLRQKGSRQKFSMPLKEAVGLIFRRAQARACSIRLGTSSFATESTSARSVSGPSSTSTTQQIRESVTQSGPSACEPASENSASEERSSETGQSQQGNPTS